MNKPFLSHFALLFALLLLIQPSQAGGLPGAFTLNLPLAANTALPPWVGYPERPNTSFASMNLPITPTHPNASLLVTVYFQEKESGFLRITWKGTYGAETLSENFYEGIAMANQRSLIVSPETLANPGVLGFQCGDTVLGISKIKLEWLEPKVSLVAAQKCELLVTPELGPTVAAQVVDGQRHPVEPGAWKDEIVTVPVTECPERVDDGVEYNVQLERIPKAGRLALKESGLPIGQHLVVWVNDKLAGTITPSVPDLADGGLTSNEKAESGYVGWRDGSFYVPVDLLKVGVNSVQFSTEDDKLPPEGTTPPSPYVPVIPPALAFKEVTLQLDYPPAPQAPALVTGDDALPSEILHASLSEPTLRPSDP